MSPQVRRAVARFALSRGLSRRRAAWLCSTPRSGMRYRSVRARRDRWLSAALRIVAREDPSWGYRLAGGYLRLRGWLLNDKRVYRLWRLNGLSLPPYRPRRKVRTGDKLDGPARHRNDVWAWDFVHDCYGDAQPLRCLTVKDEATGYCLAIKTGRNLQHQHVKATLIIKGAAPFFQSDPLFFTILCHWSVTSVCYAAHQLFKADKKRFGNNLMKFMRPLY